MPFPPHTPIYHERDPGKTGLTTGRTRKQAGLVLVEVSWGEEGIHKGWEPEQFLHERSTERPGEFGRAEDLRRLLTFEKLRGSLHDFLYSMDAAQIDFLAYQFRPVLKFIESPTERLLLADEVGLGKTIESALIWLELQARRDARRLLVICPNMIASKWRRELREKFGIQAELGGARELQDAVTDFKREGERTHFAWICTYSGLRPAKRDLPHLYDEDAELSPKGQLARTFLRWDETFDTQLFDLVIFDEAHYMRNPEAATSRLGTVVSNAAQSVLCVSATPVNNKSTDLFTLLRFVDPDFFESEFLYNQLIADNIPAVNAMRALRRLPHAELTVALACLNELRSSRFVGKTELLSRTIECVEKLKPGDHAALLRAQEMAENLNILGAYVARTRRAQIQARQPVRQPMILPVEFTAEEASFYLAITRMVRDRVARSGSNFSAFHLVMPQQRMASCIPAMVEAFRRGDFGEPDEILHESFDLNPESFESTDEDRAEENLPVSVRHLLAHDFEKHDTKYRELRRALIDLGEEKVIIFAFYKATLFYLQRRLSADGLGCAIIHGSIPEKEEREREIDRFRDDPRVRVLLSSEVGSEGIDLQFCHVVINYDLPWNPMRIAQRIGRIDRVGQQADVLKIIHFKVRDTIEERLYDRLHTKLLMAESALGDMEAILGEEIKSLTIELLSQELTPEQEIERIEQTERALERHRLELERLESEGGSLLAHSDYIADKVDQNRSLGRYLSTEELRHYINDFFERHYRGCRLRWDTPEQDLFQIDLTFDAHDALRQFVAYRKLDAAAEQVAQKITGTLLPDIARRRRRVEGRPLVLITHLSPLIRWITDECEQRGGFYQLSAVRLRDIALAPGIYAYRIERWRFTGLRDMNFMAYAAGRLEGKKLLSADEAERFANQIVRRGTTWLDAQAQFPHDPVNALIEELQENLSTRFEVQFDDFKARNDNLFSIQQTQIRSHFQRRRALDQRRLETLRARDRSPRLIHAVEVKIAKDGDKENDKLIGLKKKAAAEFELSDVAIGVALVEKGSG